MPEEFNIKGKRILRGIALLRAGAGTGKTWTLERLYVRLLCELQEVGKPPVGVANIVAVTFTEKAAREMKERIRSMIYSCLYGEGLKEIYGDLPTRTRINYLKVLGQALREFDQAAIHTIHAFCMRILGEYPIESGFAASCELGEIAGLMDQSVRECIRKGAQSGVLDEAFLSWLLENFNLAKKRETCFLKEKMGDEFKLESEETNIKTLFCF